MGPVRLAVYGAHNATRPHAVVAWGRASCSARSGATRSESAGGLLPALGLPLERDGDRSVGAGRLTNRNTRVEQSRRATDGKNDRLCDVVVRHGRQRLSDALVPRLFE